MHDEIGHDEIGEIEPAGPGRSAGCTRCLWKEKKGGRPIAGFLSSTLPVWCGKRKGAI